MAALKDQLFRKVALDRLSSPEQLDALPQVVTTKAWLMLVPLTAAVASALVWGWFGSLPTKVSTAKCLLINPVGLANVTSGTTGRVVQFTVQVGDRVAAGAQVAQVAQPDLDDRIQQGQARVREIEAQQQVVQRFVQQGMGLAQQGQGQARVLLEQQMRAARERAGFARERVQIARDKAAVQEQLLAQGLVTSQSLIAVRQEEAQARQDEMAALLEVEGQQNQIRQLGLALLEREKQGRSDTDSVQVQLSEARRVVEGLQESRKRVAAVHSPYAGRVTEIRTGVGMLVEQGSPLLTLELDSQAATAVEAVIYVPVGEGRKVRPDMETQIVPSTVRREESGFVQARVRSVSDYPATPQSMLLLLQNEVLVRELAGLSPPTEIRAVLTPADTPSGYHWSSRKGPDLRLRSGTLCQAEITLERQRPLSLVIPILKHGMGLD